MLVCHWFVSFQPFSKAEVFLYRNLHKAESRMEKLSRALDEVDQKVASYRQRFETLTKEAAELKIKLDKENETIMAAETLVSKLEGEYQRWSNQVFLGKTGAATKCDLISSPAL